MVLKLSSLQDHRMRREAPGVIGRLAGAPDPLVRTLLQICPLPLAVLDQDARLVGINDALRQMLCPDCVPEMGTCVSEIVRPGQRAALLAEVSAVLLGREPRRCAAVLRGRAEDPQQAVELHVSELRDGSDRVVGALLRVMGLPQTPPDVSLEQGHRLQALGQLAGGIAHDFNNLLTAILGAADEVIGRAAVPDDTLEDLQQIRSSAGRGAALVRQLLAFGRQQALERQPVALNGAVEGMSALFRRLLGSGVQIRLELEDTRPTAYVDPTQLDQVLMNLALNAREAMPQGGLLTLRTGRLTLLRPRVCATETIPPGQYVMVEVQDTGSGIPPDILPHIFDRFFTTKQDCGGTGLGLSTVQHIVRQSAGFIAVESALGQGTRFRIYLPQHQGTVTAMMLQQAPGGPDGVQAGSGRVVLLVDDEDALRGLATRALTRHGWKVLSAADAETALLLLADQPDDALSLLVTYAMMPGLNGPRLIEAIRASHPDVPIILTSGYAAEALRLADSPAGLTFLAKPYTLTALVDMAARVAARAGRPAPAADAPCAPVREAAPELS